MINSKHLVNTLFVFFQMVWDRNHKLETLSLQVVWDRNHKLETLSFEVVWDRNHKLETLSFQVAWGGNNNFLFVGTFVAVA